MTGTIDIENYGSITATATSEAGATGVYAHEISTGVNGPLTVDLTAA